MIKASDLLIARRADTKARADFSTWRMMAKLNVASSLSSEAQDFLAEFDRLRSGMGETAAAEATIEAIYKRYYAEMGGAGTPPDSKLAKPKGAAAEARPASAETRSPPSDNVVSLQPRSSRAAPAASRKSEKPRLPVAVIFVGLVIITVGLRYLLQ